MEDSSSNRINVNNDNDEDEEEIDTTTYCPYKKVTNFFGGFFGNNNTSSNQTTSKNDDKPKCPFGFTSSKKNNTSPKGKCPFGFGSTDNKQNNFEDEKNNEIKNEIKNEKKESEDDDSGDEEPTGGCPVMGKGRRDPQNKDFEEFYEIPCFGNYDFLFFLRGGLSQEEWLEKTKRIRKLPRHLKYTLFYQNQKKLIDVHKAEFPRVFFIYDDIKQKGIRLYNRKKYREAIEHLNYAYGLLKWIEFKDKKRQEDFIIKPSLDGILDDEIEEKSCYLDAPDVEEESFKACIINVLQVIAYCHMELRQYTNAIECLDECEEIGKNLVPDIFFRRAQARMFNKRSTDEELQKAKADIEKAIQLGKVFNEEIKKRFGDNVLYKKPVDLELYAKTSKKLDDIITSRLDMKTYNLRRLLGKVYGNKRKGNEKVDEEAIFFESCLINSQNDLDRQYRILKEMKSKYNLAVKFFTETKNNEQLELTYKEYEAFHETFEQFKYFYKFKFDSIDPKVVSQLIDEEKKMLQAPETKKIIERQKANICEYIFSHGNYNLELYKYALEKIFEEDRKKAEEEQKKEEAMRPKVSWKDYIMNISKGNFGFYLSICFIIFTLGAIGIQFYSSGPSEKI